MATTTHGASSWSHSIDADLHGLLGIDELEQHLLHVH
jgi:hypothetical protein